MTPFNDMYDLKESLRMAPLEALADAGVDPGVLEALNAVSYVLCPGKLIDIAAFLEWASKQ